MKNIEKYKDNILNADQSDITCCVIDLFHNGVCPDNCKDCKKAAMKWLLEECKEPVLDEVERKYLSDVIKPFRNKIDTISKLHSYNKIDYENNEYIFLSMKNNDGFSLPLFKQGKMYKGMQQGKHYKLKELGL